jgi:hypothetical protein
VTPGGGRREQDHVGSEGDSSVVGTARRRCVLGPPRDHPSLSGNSRLPEEVVSVEHVPAGVAGHWQSTQWRLIALVELAVPPDDPRVVAAANYVLDTNADRRPRIVHGLPRICVNVEGAALVIGSRLGMAGDPRVQRMAEALLEWQWPDGGWNCHRNASGRRSNFHESINAAWGLHEYAQATGDAAAAGAADRTAELCLEHRLFHSVGTGVPRRNGSKRPPAGQVIDQRWLKLGYPSYWHYDILAVLMLLARIGHQRPPRRRGSRPTREPTPTRRPLSRRPPMADSSRESLRPPARGRRLGAQGRTERDDHPQRPPNPARRRTTAGSEEAIAVRRLGFGIDRLGHSAGPQRTFDTD